MDDNGVAEDDDVDAVDSSDPTARRSGMQVRFRGAGLRKAAPRYDVDALLAVLDILQAGMPPKEAFNEVATVMRRAVSFDSLGLASSAGGVEPLIYCAPGQQALHDETTLVLATARRYFDGLVPFAEYVALASKSKRRWVCLPLIGEGTQVHGFLAVAGAAFDGEATIAFLVWLARSFARKIEAGAARQMALVRESNPRVVSSQLSLLRAERIARSAAEMAAKVSASVADLTELSARELPSGDVGLILQRLAAGIGDQLACGCVVVIQDVQGRRERIEHLPGRSQTAAWSILAPLTDVVFERRTTMGPIDPEAARVCLDLGVDWLLATPIVSERRVAGVLVVFGETERHVVLSMDVVERIARTLALALARHRVVEDAQALVHERDRMLSTVSHDLKNPLGVILMSAAYLLESMPPTDRRRTGRTQIEAIQRNAYRMKRLVTDLLDMDAIEAGSMSMRPERIDPRQLVDMVVADMTPAATTSRIALRTLKEPDLPMVAADADRVVQVLTNLVANALKYSKAGGRVTVAVFRHSKTEVQFAVRDTGIGISEADLAHVFDARWQAASTTGGSGLGLAICKAIVELSGGRLWCRSKPGQGTTMSFVLPVVVAAVLEEASASS